MYFAINILNAVVNFYIILIIIYVLMSWFPHDRGILYDIYKVMASVCEPYLGLFRKFVPVLGGFDISPIIAVLALEILMQVIMRVVY